MQREDTAMRNKLILLGSFLLFVMVGCASSSHFGVPDKAMGVPDEFGQTEAAIASAENSEGAKYCPEKIARAKALAKEGVETYWACRTAEAMRLLADARQLAKEAEGCQPPPRADTTPPTVTSFSIPARSSSLTVPITSFSATDNPGGTGVAGYMVTESPFTPSPSDPYWSTFAPSNYTFATEGTKTLYAWAKDAAGNVSTSLSANVTLTLPSLPPPKPRVEEKVVILASEPKAEEKVIALAAEPKVEEKVIILAFEDVHFDFDKATLTEEAQVILKRNIQILKANPKAKVRIAGYTSASGTESYNQRLSERRANAVKEYLTKEGVIAPDRLSTIGYGETRPAMYEAAPKELYSEAAKANMRVLFEIIVE
jgi:outer membrane protein OmpA-like peptidoglycan-associated protein